MTSVAFGLFTLALLIPSVVLHELAHGYVSLRHGDPTARDAGRLSFNPLRHVDPFGTVLPLIAPLWGVPALFRIDPIGAYVRRTSIRSSTCSCRDSDPARGQSRV